MRSLLFASFFIMPVVVFTQVKSTGKVKDSTVSTKVNGRVMIANRGLAPIPAFSFNSPLGMGFLSLKRGRFSYEPNFALGLNGMPWLADNWFRYTFMERGKWQINAGIDPFLYFRNEMILSKKTIEVQRNLTLEMAGEFKFSQSCSLKLTWWYIR